ncbi:hypothetical protein [Aureimonas ureilytica]|uniref:hypothetical protein n=1 Tax=Aureimonas ureilytica TaxID=401562 RepID=UPI000379DC28|nr:hypothetical protein [Aureimonas ureilytica]
MPANSRADDLRSAIVELVEAELGSAGIESIDVIETEDHDGDPALLVEIHYSGDDSAFDPKRASTLVTKLNDRLFELGEKRFAYVEYGASDADVASSPAF